MAQTKRKKNGTTDAAKAESVERAVKLATNSLDGQELSDEELDGLCEATLSEAKQLPSGKVGRKR